MKENNKYIIKNRIWIEDDNGTFLAEGRVNLLKHIHNEGSINAACKKMNMSYRKAWQLVNSMNESSLMPLVVKEKGGSGGGKTTLTSEGKRAIRLFEKLNQECRSYLADKMKELDL